MAISKLARELTTLGINKKLKNIISVKDFGAVGDGIIDDYLSFQIAINYLTSLGGGKLLIPTGNYKFISGTPKLPVNLTGKMVVSGYGAKLIVAAGQRCFDINSTANHDSFQNIFFEGFDVDATAMTGRNHVLYGVYTNGVTAYRVQFKNVHAKDINITGPNIDPTLTNHVIMINATTKHSAANEATQDVIDNISLTNVHAVGGNGGFIFNGIAPSNSANVFIDRVSIINCSHAESTYPPQFFSSSHLQVGQDALVGRVEIANFKGKNSGDNSIEINNANSVRISNVESEGCYNTTMYIANYNPNFDSSKQNIVYDTCTLRLNNSRGFQIGSNNTVGTVTYKSCKVIESNLIGNGGFALTTPSAATIKKLVVDGLDIQATVSASLSASSFCSAINLNSANAGNFSLKSITATIGGTVTLNGFIFNFRLANLIGINPKYILDTVDLNYNVVNGTQIKGINTGENATDAVNINVSNYTVTSNVACSAIRVESTGTVDSTHQIIASDCDFRGASTTVPVYVADSADKDFIKLRNVKSSYLQTPETLTASGSPYTYKNQNMYPVQVIITGGTVSNIESTVGGSFYSLVQTSGYFVVENGQSLRITYTVAPSIRVVHLPAM